MQPVGGAQQQREEKDVQPGHVAVCRRRGRDPGRQPQQDEHVFGAAAPRQVAHHEAGARQRDAQARLVVEVPERGDRVGAPAGVTVHHEDFEGSPCVPRNRAQGVVREEHGLRGQSRRRAREARYGEQRRLDSGQIEEVDREEQADRKRGRRHQGQTEAPVAEVRQAAPHPVRKNAEGEQRHEDVGGLVGVQCQGQQEERRNHVPRGAQPPQQQGEGEQQEHGQQVAFRAPPALHDVPRGDDQHEQGAQGEAAVHQAAPDGVHHEQGGHAQDRVQKADGQQVQAQELDERHGKVAVQRVLAGTPGDELNRIAIAVPVDAVLQQRPGVVADGRFVLLRPPRHLAQPEQAHGGADQNQRKEQRVLRGGVPRQKQPPRQARKCLAAGPSQAGQRPRASAALHPGPVNHAANGVGRRTRQGLSARRPSGMAVPLLPRAILPATALPPPPAPRARRSASWPSSSSPRGRRTRTAARRSGSSAPRPSRGGPRWSGR